MRKISDITSYVDENNEFTDGDVPAGLRPTPLLALWFNVIQRELVNIVESAGMTLDTADDTQLWQALSGYIDSKNSTLKENTDAELEGMRTELDSTKETLSSTCVSGVRLGSASSYIPGNESSWTQNLSDGNVMTGIIIQDTDSNSADNIGGIYYRQVQYCVNGTWMNAVSL